MTNFFQQLIKKRINLARLFTNSMNHKYHFLHHIFSPSEFKPNELELIMSHFKPVQFSKNEFLLKEGDLENQYWFLEDGFIRSFVNDYNGNDITTQFYCKADVVIDWSSFFLRNPSRENIQALTDCICWQMNFNDFQTLFHSIETFREHGRKRLVNSYFNLKNKGISMIAEQAKNRYIQLMETNPQIIQNVSQQHIASYLGITKYSLSRIRKEISS